MDVATPTSNAYEMVGNGLFLQPTPAGAYHAVASPEITPERSLLLSLMSTPLSRKPSVTSLCRWTLQGSEQASLAVLYRAQERGWVEGFRQPQGPAPGQLEPVAARTLLSLSNLGQGLLSDAQGFCIASQGFDTTASEFLAAVSADIASMHERHSRYLADASGTSTGAWALVDMAGNSRVGFWPLFVGDHRFVLALGGLPALNHPALVELVWSLTVRYGGAT
ncbi:MAG: hypothetical protein Q7V88_09890 [Actinomycetota bacterium]|nr:hypothetical protein [Actinomycetota bacterium]